MSCEETWCSVPRHLQAEWKHEFAFLSFELKLRQVRKFVVLIQNWGIRKPRIISSLFFKLRVDEIDVLGAYQR